MTKEILTLEEPPADYHSSTPVNVSAVAQLSPFRYPGGKTWLVPHVKHWLRSLIKRPALFIEPFTGGGAISLTVAMNNLADKVIMVELDDEVAAVWQTILSGQGDKLARLILGFEITRENLVAELEKTPRDTLAKAFQTILKNRTFHGGILANGSGLLKHGEAGKGVASRWYPSTLAKRISQIGLVRSRIQFIHGDAFSVFDEYKHRKTAAWFIDPPYSAGKGGKRAGTRLYTHWEVNHEKLFDEMAKLEGAFLATYDNDGEVSAMADEKRFETKTVAMKGTHNNVTLELLISRDLRWVDSE